MSLSTLPQAALIYRLSGDYNPLHASPEIAAKGGFSRPILHGLCTYGMAARAAIQALADFDPTRLRRIAARFTSPVYPGERIAYDFWRVTPSTYAMRARVEERGATVLNNGVIELT